MLMLNDACAHAMSRLNACLTPRVLQRPTKILDIATRQTRRTVVRICRVQWSNHTEAEATWEREDDLKKEFS